jgi:hypothetical protein
MTGLPSFIPTDIQNLILEYVQDPEDMILMNYGRSIINRSSNKIKEIGGIVMMKHIYPLYRNTITESNKELYRHGKLHYMEQNHHLISYHKNKSHIELDGSSSR